MDTPKSAADPAESWQYRDHRCQIYAAADAPGDETAWAGYVRTKLPEGEAPDDVAVDVPGDLVAGVEEGWIGFATADDTRDVAAVRAAVERLVDQVVDLEESMDG